MKRESIDEKIKRELGIVDAAKKEAPFTGATLMQELLPIIAEYFVCNYEIGEENIVLKFFNGQTFKITAEEVK